MRALELRTSLEPVITASCMKEKGKFKAGRLNTSDRYSYFRILDLNTTREAKLCRGYGSIPQARA